jgi:uncharacterized protein YegL
MKTHITFVLDSSGSMSKIEEDTRGGFNSLLEEQQEEPSEATVTLYEFNTRVERIFDACPITDVPELTNENYTPGGNTALHDAMERGINETGQRVADLPESKQPDHVLVVVLTDGKENASETSAETVKKLVELRQREGNWEFLFIGANQDAALTAKEMGLEEDRALSMAHNDEGARSAYASTSEQIKQMRQQGETEGFSQEDQQRQDEAKDS